MQVKQKLSALASMLKTDVEGLNLDLEHETSAERPSIWNQKQVRAQWLFYSRNEKAKKDLLSIIDRNRSIAENIDDPAHHHRHAVLGVRIDADPTALWRRLPASAANATQGSQEPSKCPSQRPPRPHLSSLGA